MRNFLRIDEGEIMANDIRIGMTLDDGGSIANKNKDAHALKQTLQAASTAAQGIRVPVATSAARQGVAASQPMSAAYRAAAAQPGGGASDTNLSRGLAGQTGASGRDFAAQAQGLGGLVHVYATFAANLYAASAAFTALSKAMDTSNLIKGLDQLGAVSGRNLGSLAKQMVAVTEGAISMRDAMTSTAMASSGGMTNTAIIRMTEVAKKASLALGRDLPDSMDRITKGIIKIQPELLDELGIMTRVIPAQEAYARGIGKTASALSDFEKRQAFANAVLDEGERKFGSISLDTNPYSKVLASINNLMQGGLDLLNKVLGPIMSALSASPTGLTVALAAVGSILLKQAIPALGMYRNAAKQAQEESFSRLQKLSRDNTDRLAAGDAEAADIAEKSFQREVKTVERVDKLKKTRTNVQIVGRDVQDLTRKSIFEQTPADIAAIKARSLSLLESDKATYKTQGKILEKSLAEGDRLRAESEAKGTAASEAREDADKRRFAHSTIMAQNLDKATSNASKRQILSITSETAAISGTKAAWKMLNNEIAQSKAGLQVLSDGTPVKATGLLANGLTRVAGTFAIASAMATNLMSALQGFAMWIGVAIAAFEILDSIFSKSAKQTEEYKNALSNLNDSFDNTRRTLDAINTKDPLSYFSVESIQAKATALGELTGSLDNVILKFNKVQEAQGPWDKFWDGIWGVVGKSSKDKLIDSVSGSVIDSFKMLDEGPAKNKARDALNKIFGQPIDVNSVKGFEQSIANLDKTIVASKAKDISKLLTDISRNSNNAAESLTGFKNALADIDKQSTSLSNALTPTDDFSKLGIELQKGATKLTESLQDPITALTALRDLAKDTKTLSLLPANVQDQLISAKNNLDSLAKAQAVAAKDLTLALAEESKALANVALVYESNSASIADGYAVQTEQVAEFSAAETLALEKAQQRTAEVRKRLSLARQASDIEVTKYGNIAAEMAKVSFDMLGKGLAKALSEAAIASARSYIDLIKSSGGPTAALEADVATRQVKIQIADIEARYANTNAIIDLGLKVRELSLIEEKKLLETDTKTRDPLVYAKVLGELAAVQFARRKIDSSEPGSSRELRGLAGQAASQATMVTGGGRGTVGIPNYLPPEAVAGIKLLKESINLSFGKDSQLAGLVQQLKSIDITKTVGLKTEAKTRELQGVQREGVGLQITSTDLANSKTLLGTYNSTLETASQINDLHILDNKAKQESISLDIKEIGAKEALASVTSRTSDNIGRSNEEQLRANAANIALTTVAADRATNLNKIESERAQIINKYYQARKTGEAAIAKIEEDHQRILRANTLELKSISDTDDEARLSNLKEIGAISEADYIKQSDRLKLAAEDRKYTEERSNYLKDQAISMGVLNDQQKAFNDKIASNNALINSGTGSEQQIAAAKASNQVALASLADINAAQKRGTDEERSHLTVMDAGNTSRKLAITLTQAQKILLAEQAVSMDKMVNITDSLTSAFGELGTNIGKAGEAILSMAQQDTKYLQDKKALEDARDKTPEDSEKRKEATTALMKLDEKHAKDKLKNDANILSSTKKIFGEQTAAFKIITGMQKVASAQSLAGELKQSSIKMGLLTEEQAAKAEGYAKDLAMQASSALESIGINIPAIYASFMAALGPFGPPIAAAAIAAFVGGGFSGGGSVDMTGKTSAERQTAQGTGTVSGDTEAKSQSIVNSLDILNATTVEGLSYSNKMVELLSQVRDGISGVAKGVYGVVGLRSGSQFGTKEGESGFNILGGLFGSSSTKQITDAGLKITGTFADMMNGVVGSLKTYEDVLTTSTSSFLWMSSTSQALSQQLGDLDPKIQKSLQAVFNNAGNLMITAGEKLGMTSREVMDKLAQVDVTTLASLRGLKGKELDEALNSILSSMLDTASSTLFVSLESYNKFGEGMLETTMRVVDGMDKVNLAMTSVGRASIGTGLSGIAFSDAMITAAGGLSSFIDNTKTFADNFLTEAERLAPKQAALTKELESLGFYGVKTKETFKDLVLGFKVTNAESAITYAKLIALSSAMEEVTASSGKSLDLEQKIYELLGKSSEALAMSRSRELEAMDELLRPRQKYINALTDEIALRDKLQAAYTSTNSTLTSSIKTLQNYKAALTAGAVSTLTPAEKYAQAKSNLLETSAQAQVAITASSSAAEIATRNAAVDKISSVSDIFLASSREMYASGSQYAADFSTITDLLDSTTGLLSTQQIETQQQLDYLKITSEATQTTAELLAKYLKAQETTTGAQSDAVTSGSIAAGITIPGHARGGLAKGISLVGEKGPELVDFTNPGRVYSNAASNDLFNTKELVAEIKALRQEVSQLRSDQKEQTGHLIATNYDANIKNANAVSTATEDAFKQQEWNTRSQVKIA
jgi:hypothetical protein